MEFISFPAPMHLHLQQVVSEAPACPSIFTDRDEVSGRWLREGWFVFETWLFEVRCDSREIIEFRRHKQVTNPAHIIGFLSQWKIYLEELPQDADAKRFSGKKLDATSFEKVRTRQFWATFNQFWCCQQMSAEQLGQLYELMHATKDVWNPIKEE